MAYAPTKYANYDLMLKADRTRLSNTVDGVVKYFQKAYLDLGGPKVKNGAGVLGTVVVDGKFGPQTKNAVKAFQAACALTQSGWLDQLTYFQLDWRVFAWVHHHTNTSQTGAGGRAYVSKNGYAYNMYMTPDLPVNINGLCREAQRLTDVIESYHNRSMGYEGAVNRNAVGSSGLSRHALGLAGDDMGDQDKDRIVEGNELAMQKASWDYLIRRANVGWDAQLRTGTYIVSGARRTLNMNWRGHDLLVTMVLGNRRFPAGNLIFPANTAMRDVSWTAVRNSPKSLTGTVHVSPFHLHSDCAFGAPYGSPFG